MVYFDFGVICFCLGYLLSLLAAFGYGRAFALRQVLKEIESERDQEGE